MRKTASYRVLRLSGFCTDPEEADKKIREAIGWGVQLQKRTVRMIKLERLLRSSVGTGKVDPFGETVLCQNLPWDGWRIMHDRIKQEIMSMRAGQGLWPHVRSGVYLNTWYPRASRAVRK